MQVADECEVFSMLDGKHWNVWCVNTGRTL